MKVNSEDPAVKKPLIASPNLFPVVGIGASAGGLAAFKNLLQAIPENSGMAFVLVQHLDPNHDSLLPEILQKVTNIPVLEIADDIKVLPDHIYVIPSNKMMIATDGVLLLAPRPSKGNNERNLPIDLFFTSLAEVHQEHAIGVVLSGTASDGTQGLKAIKEHGGITFAQDEASAEYDSMPKSAVQAGVVDFVLPPGNIPQKLLEVTQKTILTDLELQSIPKQEENIFRQILSLLRIRKGVDFTYYKQTTIRRRILRRMMVNKNDKPADYLNFLRTSTPEQDLLYQDMLIPVTSFFRDPKVFDNLCHEVFPNIIKNKVPGEITRIWVAGCSTGQEVYSYAMCFKEFLGDKSERIQIFGTDLSEPAIIKARTGIYEKSELEAVSPERLKEFFTVSHGAYQVNKSIRDMCVFALHNFLKDPPFGKMDCISCRNVLIYMEPYLQKKALTTFHYALNPKGFLLLGKSETTGGVPELFASVGKNDKLYTRKDVPGRFIQVTSQRSEQILSRVIDPAKSEIYRTDFQKTADDILLSKYTPAGVIVNESLDIVHFRGNTANYLEQASGKPSHNLLIMARNGLGFELRNILHKAKVDKLAVVKENIPINIHGNLRSISIEAIPLPNTLEPYYLVLFHDHNLTDSQELAISQKKRVSAKTKNDEKDIQIQLLEQELAQAREDMRSITEDQEASNEELQSANEELLSGGEELQSLNEELETSKEELQSTNEELTVLNHELVGLNEQVTEARNYSESIIATLHQPLLVLDRHLRVKTANKAFYKTFKVKEAETEGILVYDLGDRQWNIPELRTLLEEILPQKSEITDYEVTHNFSAIGEKVLLLNALEIKREKKEEKLILLSIEDITVKTLALKKKEEIDQQLQNIFTQAPAAICLLEGPEHKFILANKEFQQLSSRTEEQLLGFNLRQAFPEFEGKGIYEIYDDVYKSGKVFTVGEFPAIVNMEGRGMVQFYYNFVAQPLKNSEGNIYAIMHHAVDVTEQVEARRKVEESETKYHSLFETMDQGFCIVEVIFDEHNNPIDYLFVEVNPVFETQSGLTNATGKTVLELIPNLEKHWIDIYGKVVTTGESLRFVEGSLVMGRMFDVYAFKVGEAESRRVAVLFSDITQRKRAENSLIESEERFRSLVMATSNTVYKMSADWKIMYNLEGKDFLADTTDSNISWLEKYIPEEERQKVMTTIEEAIATKNIFELEHQVFDAEGNIAWTYSRAVPKMNEKGALIEWTGAASNITERKKAEQTLIESEAKYRSLISNAPIAIGILRGREFVIESPNQTFLNFIGKDESVIGKPLAKAMPELKGQPFLQILDDVFSSGIMFHSCETPGKAIKDGVLTDGYYDVTYQPLLNENGEVYAILNIMMDITTQVTATKKIEESESFNRAVLESSPDCIKMLDAEGRLLFMNTNGICLLEIDDFKSIQNSYWSDMWEPENKQLIKEAINKAKKGEKVQFQLFSPTAKGTPKWWDIIVLPVQEDGTAKNLHRILSVSRDITKQKLNELKEKELLTRFQNLVVQAPVAICVLRGENYLIEVINEGMVEMWGKKSEDVLNKPAFDVLPELLEQGFKTLLDTVFHSGERFVTAELPINLHRNGTLENAYVKFVYEPLREADGSITGVMALAHEITEQVMARKTIEESETKFRTLIENAPVATCFFTGRDMTIEVANDIMIEYWGKGKNVIGKKLVVAVPELKGQPFLQQLEEVYTTGKIFESKNEPAQLKLNGVLGTYYFDYTYKPILNTAGKVYGIMNMALDVTEQVLAVNRIKESEARFRTLADDSPLFIFTIETATLAQVSYWNKTWLDYTGQSCEEAMERNWDGIIHPDDMSLVMQIYTTGLESKKSYFIPAVRVLRHDGVYRWYSFKSNPRYLANGDFHGSVGVGFDIHEQKLVEDALKESTQQFTSMADNIAQLAWMMDAKGSIYWYNQRWYDYTGSDLKEVEGWKWQKLLEPEKVAQITQRLQEAIASGTDWEDTFLLRGTDGLYKWFLSRAVPIRDTEGKVIKWFGTNTDITDQKEANKKAEAATLLAEEAMKAKQQFLSNMSHEIRTPMNAIVGFTNVVLKTQLDEKQKKYIKAIQASGDSLIVLINDILDLAKVDAGKMTFQRIPFQMTASITAMLNLFEIKIQEKNITLVKEYDNAIPEVLLGDPARLHQIIINLISNSLKFTETGTITVGVHLLEENDEKAMIEFTITDTGIGISESSLVYIFEAFQQATSQTSQLFGGTGLGLSIVKQLVESQGGTVAVHSKEGKGSTFSFILNFEKTATESAVETELVVLPIIQNLKVLVVEDVKLNQLLMRILLEDLGIEVDVADNGKRAVEQLETQQYDIIFMDLQMPEMNGFEATEYIRNTMKSKIPIVALTADVTTVDLEKCKAMGMDDYISKPIDEKLLYHKIIKYMPKRDL